MYIMKCIVKNNVCHLLQMCYVDSCIIILLIYVIHNRMQTIKIFAVKLAEKANIYTVPEGMLKGL
jgi:hypothetical protein